jgi:hypothetical protein
MRCHSQLSGDFFVRFPSRREQNDPGTLDQASRTRPSARTQLQVFLFLRDTFAFLIYDAEATLSVGFPMYCQRQELLQSCRMITSLICQPPKLVMLPLSVLTAREQ